MKERESNAINNILVPGTGDTSAVSFGIQNIVVMTSFKHGRTDTNHHPTYEYY